MPDCLWLRSSETNATIAMRPFFEKLIFLGWILAMFGRIGVENLNLSRCRMTASKCFQSATFLSLPIIKSLVFSLVPTKGSDA